MKKIIVLAATIIAAALMSGCTNYKKMAQDDPVDYLTIAAQNTFKAVSEKNILDITSQAYNAINSGTVTVALTRIQLTPRAQQFPLTKIKRDIRWIYLMATPLLTEKCTLEMTALLFQ